MSIFNKEQDAPLIWPEEDFLSGRWAGFRFHWGGRSWIVSREITAGVWEVVPTIGIDEHTVSEIFLYQMMGDMLLSRLKDEIARNSEKIVELNTLISKIVIEIDKLPSNQRSKSQQRILELVDGK